MIKLRPSTTPTRKLVIPYALELHGAQVAMLLEANGFRFDDTRLDKPKLSSHAELTHHEDRDVWEQWDAQPAFHLPEVTS